MADTETTTLPPDTAEVTLTAESIKLLLAVEKAKQDALLASIGDGIIGTDQTGGIVVMNTAAKSMLGWTAEEVMGKNLFEIVSVEDEDGRPILKNKQTISSVFDTGVPVSIPSSFYIAKDKRKIPVAINVTPIMLEDRIIGTVNVFRDISHETALRRTREEFESLATHQLRTPITTIKWNTEVLEGSGQVSPEDRDKALKDIHKAANLLTRLVNAMLNIAKMESGALGIVPEPVFLPDLVKEVAGELTAQIEGRHLHFETKFEEQLPVINLDPQLINTILRNLLSNSIKYTPDGGKILLKVAAQIQDVLITISDTGIGVPRLQQVKVFTKFFRADNVRADQTQGSTGLGLYITKLITEQCGGRIWFESEEGKGTTFYVSIPLTGMKQKEGVRGLA